MFPEIAAFDEIHSEPRVAEFGREAG